ncbi:MAG: 50S ribosomal protein L9 [Pseudomonadales bacterium]|nr:50S ribosomal protein L9 [Pseudomonadales bacterium]
MEVILLEKTRNLGDLGDKVSVKAGYGRNYLIPQGKAVPATASNVEHFESRRAELEKKAQENKGVAEGRLESLEKLSVTIAANSGEEGKLFGSIGTRDLAIAITEAGVPIEKSEINLPEGAIRLVGDYDISIQLHNDVVGVVKVAIVAE